MIRTIALLFAGPMLIGCTVPLSVETVDETPPAPWVRPTVEAPPPTPPAPALTTPATDSGLALERVTGPYSLKGKRIVVDAGHGGKDPGAKGVSAASEKSITLAVALELQRRLKAKGALVTLTRSSDQYVELDDRAAAADRVRADLLVSLHADSSERTSASGVGVWIGRNSLGLSQKAAQEILRSVKAAGLKVRGLQKAGFRVLVGHKRAAVLVECGFLTNQDDATRLNSPSYQGRLAEAIATGIERSIGR
ncbi:MAG: N-acetylmuramoyl-L-alanine amidase [Planctomycetota bacterium]